MGEVANAILETHGLNNWRQRWIMKMANSREQVMFDLIVEPADVPGDEPTLRRKIDRRLYLVSCPLPIHDSVVNRRLFEMRFLHTVSELKYYPERCTKSDR